MKVIVDTSAWSLVLRRKAPQPDVVAEVERLIRRGRVQLLGVIRQEALSGIETAERFADLRQRLSHFPDFPVTSQDHEDAARAFNKCRGHGVQGNVVDMLVCSVAMRHDMSVFTFDDDFDDYHRFLKFKRHHVGA